MKKTRIALIVDNPLRDLPGQVLIAWELAKQGFECLLVPFNLQHKEIFFLAPDIILLNYIRVANEDFVKKLIEAGILVGVLDTEGAMYAPIPASASTVTFGNPIQKNELQDPFFQYVLFLPRDPSLLKKIHFFLAWNSEIADYLTKNKLFLAQQVTVTGHPRVDLISPPFIPVSKTIASRYVQIPKPIILIVSNFSMSNPAFQSPVLEKQIMIDKFNYTKEYMDAWFEAEESALREFSKLANELAHSFPGVNIVYRPHPFENIDTYQNLIARLPNLHVIKEGTIESWLIHSIAMIHWSSSVALEAAILKVPVFRPKWVPEFYTIPMTNGLTQELSLIDLKNVLSQIVENKFVQINNYDLFLRESIEKSFYMTDGLAYKRIANIMIEKAKTSSINVSVEYCIKEAYSRFLSNKTPLSRFVNFIRKKMNLSVHWSFTKQKKVYQKELSWDKTAKAFTKENVQMIVNAIEDKIDHSHTSAIKVDTPLYLGGYKEGRTISLHN